jgi:hypothetical protein
VDPAILEAYIYSFVIGPIPRTPAQRAGTCCIQIYRQNIRQSLYRSESRLYRFRSEDGEQPEIVRYRW